MLLLLSSAGASLASVAAQVLLKAGLMERCLVLLRAILVHWKSSGSSDEAAVVAALLRNPGAGSAAGVAASSVAGAGTTNQPLFSLFSTHLNLFLTYFNLSEPILTIINLFNLL